MDFTKAQAKKVEQIKEIAKLGGVDFWNMEREPDNEVRNVLLDIGSSAHASLRITF